MILKDGGRKDLGGAHFVVFLPGCTGTGTGGCICGDMGRTDDFHQRESIREGWDGVEY